MKVLNEYPNSHHYIEDWERTEGFFCPYCGDPNNLYTCASGDYYMGCEYICTSCRQSSYLDHCSHDDSKESIVQQLISGITATPTTPKGL